MTELKIERKEPSIFYDDLEYGTVFKHISTEFNEPQDVYFMKVRFEETDYVLDLETYELYSDVYRYPISIQYQKFELHN